MNAASLHELIGSVAALLGLFGAGFGYLHRQARHWRDEITRKLDLCEIDHRINNIRRTHQAGVITYLIAVLRRLAPEAPELESAQAMLTTMEDEIAEARARLLPEDRA